jgi:hypothetical protein
MKSSPNETEQGFLTEPQVRQFANSANFPILENVCVLVGRREKIAPFFVSLASPVLILSKFALKSALNRSNQRR